ncbi:hypothetical protein B0H17DRAFT_1215574 [Mycena rosella]|uniref:Uncharacterized protein n=1 Tax=Mycena rosella TaxID=1033263 RepID=A0AAD7G1D0_MYCRO|nr:hypothetical protein B0H17DRAFT_1215574 [Mycena rosella]
MSGIISESAYVVLSVCDIIQRFRIGTTTKKAGKILEDTKNLLDSVATEPSRTCRTRVDPFTLKYEEAPSEEAAATTVIPIPHAPPPAPPLYEELEAVSLLFGSMIWGENIAGQVHALFDLMPQPYAQDKRRQIAVRTTDVPHMVMVQFPNADDALAFQNGWNEGPPEEYTSVRASLVEPPTMDLVESE